MSALQTITHNLVLIVSAVPTPGDPEAPPGFDRVDDILGWVKWGCLGLLVAALMIAGARLGFAGRHGDGSEHAGRIGSILIGVMVIGAAGALIGFVAT